MAETLERAREKGVEALVQIATDLGSSRKNWALAKEERTEKSPALYWTAGLHPCSASEAGGLEELEEISSIIEKNRDDPSFIGIGETGLDYFHTEKKEDIERQKKSLSLHLEWAQKYRLPVILHTRDDRVYHPEKKKAIEDCLGMLKESGVRGVLHCFSYTHREALPFVDLGCFVSYSGVLTFPNAKAVQEGMLKLPLDCLLVETDAPFLAPVPHRGKLNEPAYVRDTLNFLAQLRAKHCEEEIEEVKQNILSNARRFLSLKDEL